MRINLKNKHLKIILSILVVFVMVATFLGVSSFIKGADGEKEILISILDEENDIVIIENKAFYSPVEFHRAFNWCKVTSTY